MARDPKDATVVITGGTGDIGIKIVKHFLKNGAKHVVLLGMKQNVGEKYVREFSSQYGNRTSFVKCDVTKDLEITVKKLLDSHKTIDVLVNCSGVIEETNFLRCIAINFTAVVEWSLKFFELMRTDKGGNGGTIINVASIYGFRTDETLATYTGTKHGVTGFTKALGNNFNKTGVRTIVICPGYTITQLLNPKPNPHEFEKDIPVKMELYGTQDPDVVGQAVVQTYRTVNSATVWVIEKSELTQHS